MMLATPADASNNYNVFLVRSVTRLEYFLRTRKLSLRASRASKLTSSAIARLSFSNMAAVLDYKIPPEMPRNGLMVKISFCSFRTT